MKDTDFQIKFDTDTNSTLMYLPEFNTVLEFADNMVIADILSPITEHSYQDFELDLSPILHWINHMYNVEHMLDIVKESPVGVSGNTKTFRRVYNQLMKQTNAYKLNGVSVIADTE